MNTNIIGIIVTILMVALSGCQNLPGYTVDSCEEVSGYTICRSAQTSEEMASHLPAEEWAKYVSATAQVFEQEYPGVEACLKDKSLNVILFPSTDIVSDWCNMDTLGCHRPGEIAISYTHVNEDMLIMHEIMHHAISCVVGGSGADSGHEMQDVWIDHSELDSLEYKAYHSYRCDENTCD